MNVLEELDKLEAEVAQYGVCHLSSTQRQCFLPYLDYSLIADYVRYGHDHRRWPLQLHPTSLVRIRGMVETEMTRRVIDKLGV